MKKLLVAGMTFAGTLGLFAQGQLNFNNFLVNTVVFHVYAPQLATPSVEVQGNSSVAYSTSVRSGDFSQNFANGSQTYTGPLIGGFATGSGPTGYANGANYDAALYFAPGDNSTATVTSGMTLATTSLTTFATSPSVKAGFINNNSPVINGIAVGANGTFEMAAWYNNGGLVNDYATAVADGFPAGYSMSFNVDALGGTDPILGNVNVPNILNAQSFSLVTAVPEPSTIAFGVMGVCAFLARRRKK